MDTGRRSRKRKRKQYGLGYKNQTGYRKRKQEEDIVWMQEDLWMQEGERICTEEEEAI